jgi:hypothetical protein
LTLVDGYMLLQHMAMQLPDRELKDRARCDARTRHVVCLA